MKREKEKLNSNSGFSDPARIKEQREVDKPKDGKSSPWNFQCPQYDQRSSDFVNAGTYYGSGINQPVGHMDNPKQHVPVLPFGRVNTMRVEE